MFSTNSFRVAFFAMLMIGHINTAIGQAPKAPSLNNSAPIYPPIPPPDFILKVSHNKNRTPKAQLKVFQSTQDILNQARIGVPADRLRYFQTVISPNSDRVVGWYGIINSITPIEIGSVVEMRVYANQGSTLDSVHIIERYSITDRGVNYLGAVLPPPYPRFQVGF